MNAAAELNNLGVALIKEGDLQESLDLLRTALRATMMGETMSRSEYETAVRNATGPGPGRGDESDKSEFGRRNKSNVDQFLLSQQAFTSATASTPFVYANGINILSSPTAYATDSLVNTTIVSSLIIFNLGIVYHLKGLEGDSMSAARLSKAKNLYRKSLGLLRDAGIVDSFCTGNPVIDMLFMALFNNLAQLSFETSQFDESRNFFQGLIRFAITVTPARYVDVETGTLIDQQRSNFLLNAIILNTGGPKLAPAA